MGNFDREEFEELLVGLDSSHESIVNSSSRFLNLDSEWIEAATQVFFDSFRKAVSHSLLKHKVAPSYQTLNYLYLANDILQKAKVTNGKMLKAFQTHLPDLVSLLCQSNSDRPLFKEILKVLKIWRDRQVYPEAFMVGMIATVDKTMLERKKEKRDDMPTINFDIDDLYGYAHNKKHLEIWNEKVEELKTQLDILFKNSSLPYY